MNNIRKALAVSAIAMLATLGVQAQESKTIAPMSRAWVVINTEMLNVQLKLNDEQQQQVKEINERYIKKHDALVAVSPKPTEAEMSDQVEALMVARDKDMRGVLNVEQYAEWEKKRHMGTSELGDEKQEEIKEKNRD